MKKREGVYASPSGKSIIIGFYYKKERHRETIKKDPSAANLNWAEIKHKAIMAEIANEAAGGAPFDYARHFPDSKSLKRQKGAGATVVTLKPAIDEWFKRQRYEKPTVVRQYRGYINKVIEFYGANTLISDVNKVTEIERYITSLQDAKLEVKTIKNRLIPLYGVLQRAARDEIVESNAMHKLEPLKQSEAEKIRRKEKEDIEDRFDVEEIRAISKAYAGRPMLNMFLFAIWSGLRVGEILALAWEDIDWVHHKIRVRCERSEGKFVTPKTAGSARLIDMLPQAEDALRDHKQYTWLKEPVDCGPFGKRSIIFYQPTMDHPFERSQQLTCRVWPRMLRVAGVRYRPPKYTRHSFASICISAGEDREWIKDQLGHSTMAMLEKIYGKWLAQAAAVAGNTGGSRVRQLAI